MSGPGQIGDAILALDEPWRGRFLKIVARWATGGTWDGRGEVTREDLVVWLRMDPRLRHHVALLLHTWRRPEL